MCVLAQVTMVNRMIEVMWPTLTKAVINEVIKQIKPILKTMVFDKVSPRVGQDWAILLI